MELDPATAEKSEIHRALTSVVAPRPIGWISTRSSDGRDNLAPFSYFNGVSTKPPMVVFGPVDAPDGRLKHTPTNVFDTGEFACNLVTEHLLPAADRSGEPVGPDVDEFDLAGVEKAPAAAIDVPRVASARAVLECTLYDSVDLPTSTIVVGEVQHVYVDDALCTDGRVDARKIDAVGRLGGPYFSGVEPLPFERGDG